MQRDWETRLSGKLECDTSVGPLAGIFRNTVLENVKEVKHAEARTIPESDHTKQAKQVKGLCQARSH
jgi:hypothetical protein